jgi:hypothetical protein
VVRHRSLGCLHGRVERRSRLMHSLRCNACTAYREPLGSSERPLSRGSRIRFEV